jgi:hypothetical protein
LIKRLASEFNEALLGNAMFLHPFIWEQALVAEFS